MEPALGADRPTVGVAVPDMIRLVGGRRPVRHVQVSQPVEHVPVDGVGVAGKPPLVEFADFGDHAGVGDPVPAGGGNPMAFREPVAAGFFADLIRPTALPLNNALSQQMFDGGGT